MPSLISGQKSIPVDTAGCYVPDGRYNHLVNAIMAVTTPQVAVRNHIIACSPRRMGVGIATTISYAAYICGVNKILAMGGVQGVASMTYELVGLPKANILVGPGNQFVAEAKRMLFGRVGIDMIAGPTDSLVLANASTDPFVVATGLVSQAEHGYNSPVWLVTDDQALAEEVLAIIPKLIDDLSELNRNNAFAAWRDYAEDLDWSLDRLSCYGSLFLGEETTVSYGDKAAGTNHVLPSSGATYYTGGLSA